MRFRLPEFRGLAGATSRWSRPLSSRRPRQPATGILVLAVIVGIVSAAVPAGLMITRPSVRLHGLPGGGMVDTAALAGLSVTIEAPGVQADRLHVRLDGRRLSLRSSGDAFVVDLPRLADGEHTLSVVADSFLGLRREERRRFTVDTQPPRLSVPGQVWASSFTEPVTVEGAVSGATRVAADGEPVGLRGGDFRVRVRNPPATLTLTAADAAGNTTSATTRIGVTHPGMRAVHMTGPSWRSDALRKPIMAMIRQGKIDTVELDIKDEAGHVGYDSDVALANKINADKGYYDAEKVIDKLHSMGVRVVGRLVCFQDHVLAEAAWKSGHRNRVIQTPGGGAYSGGYGEFAFTNFANPVVRQYNIDLAVEAAKVGFDGILFDYIRRPDGYLRNMVFPGLEKETPSESITRFVREAAEAIHEAGAFVGVSVFGVAATRPKSVAQNIPQMAKYADYISPMVYPSHWGPGEYGVAHPNTQPYKIVKRSLRDFQRAVRGTGAEIIPWLQDFSLGVTYGPAKVRAQIQAARDVGIDSFLLWNAGATYTSAALRTPKRAPS